jgi:hypothetical protein
MATLRHPAARDYAARLVPRIPEPPPTLVVFTVGLRILVPLYLTTREISSILRVAETEER